MRFNDDLFQAGRMYAYIGVAIGLALLGHAVFASVERRLIHNQATHVRTGIDRQAAVAGRQRMPTGLGMAALALALIGVWHGVAKAPIIPAPIETIRVLWRLLASGSLYPHVIATLQPALYGFGLAFVAGGTIPAVFKLTEHQIYPKGVIIANSERAGAVKPGSVE